MAATVGQEKGFARKCASALRSSFTWRGGLPLALPPSAVPRGEKIALALLFTLALGLRFTYAFRFRIDSDELQHLHVVWGWTQGKLPYRDFFDNHMPLFQAAMAPLFKALGPRADIVAWMRLAVLPLFMGMIWLVQRLAAQSTNNRVGWWAALVTAFLPPFFFLSIEFRPDELWSVLWLALLLVLLRPGFSLARGAGLGLLLGLAFCVSMKTSLLLTAALFGSLAWLDFSGRLGTAARRPWRNTAFGAVLILGFAALPAALVAVYFARQGSWAAFKYCIIAHNTAVESKVADHLVRRTILWIPFFLATLAAALGLRRVLRERHGAFCAAYLFFAAVSYLTILRFFWPMFALEDYLPFFPALFAGILPPLLVLAWNYLPRWRLPAALPVPVAIAGELACIFVLAPPWHNETGAKTALIADVLRITDPTDCVLDAKGESVYRERPVYLAVESVTRRGILNGRIPGDFSADLIRTATPVVMSHRMPTPSRSFVKANYLPVAFRLAALGQVLFKAGSPAVPPRALPFHVQVPGEYRVVGKQGAVEGKLNGRPWTGAEYLGAGDYIFEPSAPDGGSIVLIWAKAIERGASPFAMIPRDYTTEQD